MIGHIDIDDIDDSIQIVLKSLKNGQSCNFNKTDLIALGVLKNCNCLRIDNTDLILRLNKRDGPNKQIYHYVINRII